MDGLIAEVALVEVGFALRYDDHGRCHFYLLRFAYWGSWMGEDTLDFWIACHCPL